jgi:casein kinase II subunit beta
MRAYTVAGSTAMAKRRKIEETLQALGVEPESCDEASYGVIQRLCFLFLCPRHQVRSIPPRICRINSLASVRRSTLATAFISELLLTILLQFISSRGNEYFCEIDEDYLTDRFNLTGLNTEVQYYQYALDLVTDVFDLDCDDEMRETIEKSARHLYGLVHARYIVTTRGLAKMVRTLSLRESIGRLTWVSAREVQESRFREMPKSDVQVTSLITHGAIRQSER